MAPLPPASPRQLRGVSPRPGAQGTHLNVGISTTRSALETPASMPTLVPRAQDPTPSRNVSTDILRANALLNRSSSFSPIPPVISSPVNLRVLSHFLRSHPQQSMAIFIIQNFVHGFDLGFVGLVSSSIPRNLRSARRAAPAVSLAIQKEVNRGHSAGPFTASPLRNFHCSPLGAVPKPDGSVRLILNLSFPGESSVNSGISPDEYSVRYSSFDDAIDIVRNLGPSCFMAKLDIRHAYRICPVREEDYPLLGFSWNNQFFFDLRLPFGCRSSAFLFNSFADALAWILVSLFGIAFVIHYSDDFFVAARTHSSCQSALDAIISIFDSLGIPIALDKLFRPSKVTPFLGIEIDSREMIMRLPASKLSEVKELLKRWLNRKKCTKRELQSITGKLQFC